MARYRVELTSAAARELRKLDRQDADRVTAAIRKLEDDPRPHGATKLSGRGEYRIRVGDHRVIYEIDDSKVVVTVIKIGNRRDVYKGSW
jgi:mRNA interferase RelE/StbE